MLLLQVLGGGGVRLTVPPALLHAGVFFVVCMALLMLSLIKSILVVKLLHHNDRDVKQMSLSACLLDRYGSGGQEVPASALTSFRDSVDPSDGELPPENHANIVPCVSDVRPCSSDYELETSLEEDLLSLDQEQKVPCGLDWLLQELGSLRQALHQEDAESSAQADWLDLCLKLDRVLFWVYLLVLVLYAGTLMLLWMSWSFA